MYHTHYRKFVSLLSHFCLTQNGFVSLLSHEKSDKVVFCASLLYFFDVFEG